MRWVAGGSAQGNGYGGQEGGSDSRSICWAPNVSSLGHAGASGVGSHERSESKEPGGPGISDLTPYLSRDLGQERPGRDVGPREDSLSPGRLDVLQRRPSRQEARAWCWTQVLPGLGPEDRGQPLPGETGGLWPRGKVKGGPRSFCLFVMGSLLVEGGGMPVTWGEGRELSWLVFSAGRPRTVAGQPEDRPGQRTPLPRVLEVQTEKGTQSSGGGGRPWEVSGPAGCEPAAFWGTPGPDAGGLSRVCSGGGAGDTACGLAKRPGGQVSGRSDPSWWQGGGEGDKVLCRGPVVSGVEGMSEAGSQEAHPTCGAAQSPE